MAEEVQYLKLKDQEAPYCDVLIFPQITYTEDLLKVLLGETPSNEEDEGSVVVKRTWTLSTKYYDCHLSLFLTSSLHQVVCSNEIGAIILYFEPDKKESWDRVRNLEAWIKGQQNVGVKLLVCTDLTNTASMPKTEVTSWCSDHDFELIDLNEPAEDEYDVTGVARIKQSLAAHSWPNLVMKEKPDIPSAYMERLRSDVLKDQADAHTATAQLDENLVNSAMNDGGESGVESFEKLFSELNFMKEKAGQLSPTSRKGYAERVAMSFLSALGDDSGDSD